MIPVINYAIRTLNWFFLFQVMSLIAFLSPDFAVKMFMAGVRRQREEDGQGGDDEAP